MVVVKHGPLPPPGKQYKIYLNVDKLKQKWYLRVTHTYPQYNQHFRAGTYKSKEEAMDALKTLDPVNPKKGRQRKGTVDQYNGQWRVRAKHRGEHMHVGYFKDREKAEQRLKEVIADTEFLEKRYNSLIAKRKRKRESMNQHPMLASLATLHAKLKKMEERQSANPMMICNGAQDWFPSQTSPRNMRTLNFDGDYNDFSRPAFRPKPRPGDPFYSEPITSLENPFSRLGVTRNANVNSDMQNYVVAAEQWQRMQNGFFHDAQRKWQKELVGNPQSEEDVNSDKKKVRIQKRCLSCSKTQIIQASVYSLDSDSRLVYVQCESCRKEPVDVGWCGPAVLQTDRQPEKNLQDQTPTNLVPPETSPVMCDPKTFWLKSPITYAD